MNSNDRAGAQTSLTYVPQLTAIRFFAAALVACHHFLGGGAVEPWVRFLANIGDVAVSLFFILSGFVLTLANLDLDGRLVKTRWQYAAGRFARIYPQYLFSFFFAAPFFLLVLFGKYPGLHERWTHGAANAIAYLSMLQAWLPDAANAWNGPGWSLSVEFFFYAAFPWLILIILPGRLLFAVMAAVALAVAPVLSYSILKGNYSFWYFFPPFRMGEFVIGMAAGTVYVRDKLPRLMPSSWHLLLVMSLVCMFAAVSCLGAVWIRMSSTLCVPLILLAASKVEGVAKNVLSSGYLVALGEASFGLYLIHVPTFGLYGAIMYGDPLKAQYRPLEFLGCLLIAVALSLVLHRLYERPMANVIKRVAAHAGLRARPPCATEHA